jgi:hypothetical protein
LANRLTWKTHIDEVRANAYKRMNLLKYLAGMKGEADQGMLLKVHEMIVLSALEFSSAAYGAARHGQLKRLEPVHNKGLRIAIGACESGFERLAERKRRKTINTAIQEPLDSKLKRSKASKMRDCKSSRECTLTDL